MCSHTHLYTVTPRHANHMHLPPDARVWSHIHAHVQTHILSVSVTDCQSWKRLSLLFLSPPALSPSPLSSPPFFPSPQPVLGGSPALWAQPWKEMLSFPRGQILRHRQHSALKKQGGLERCQVKFDTLPTSLPFLTLAGFKSSKNYAPPQTKQSKKPPTSLPLLKKKKK